MLVVNEAFSQVEDGEEQKRLQELYNAVYDQARVWFQNLKVRFHNQILQHFGPMPEREADIQVEIQQSGGCRLARDEARVDVGASGTAAPRLHQLAWVLVPKSRRTETNGFSFNSNMNDSSTLIQFHVEMRENVNKLENRT